MKGGKKKRKKEKQRKKKGGKERDNRDNKIPHLETGACLALQLYGSLVPSRSNAPPPRVSTLTALRFAKGLRLGNTLGVCGVWFQKTQCDAPRFEKKS